MSTLTINAIDLIDYSRPVVESAEEVAERAVQLLQGGESVIVSMKGVRGASSSFYNVLLAAVSGVLNGKLTRDRFDVETDTKTQQFIFQRSWDAFTKPRSEAS